LGEELLNENNNEPGNETKKCNYNIEKLHEISEMLYNENTRNPDNAKRIVLYRLLSYMQEDTLNDVLFQYNKLFIVY